MASEPRFLAAARPAIGALSPDLVFLDVRMPGMDGRSTIVNIERIREGHPPFNGNAEVILHDGTHLNLGRRFRQRVQQVPGKA